MAVGAQRYTQGATLQKRASFIEMNQPERSGGINAKIVVRASALLVAEKQFRRIRGYKQLPVLLRVLETLKPSRKAVAGRRKAS
jgi:uncharacterized membrane protein (UPF0136 family)